MALDYAQPSKNQYAFKMEGFDSDWIHIGNRKYASYTNLDPGEYIFRVKASNNNGVWNEEGGSQETKLIFPFKEFFNEKSKCTLTKTCQMARIMVKELEMIFLELQETL